MTRVRAALRRCWRGVLARVGAAVDVGGRWARTTSEDEAEWLYDNRERAHMTSGCWCNSPNSAPKAPACPYHGGSDFDGTCGWCG